MCTSFWKKKDSFVNMHIDCVTIACIWRKKNVHGINFIEKKEDRFVL